MEDPDDKTIWEALLRQAEANLRQAEANVRQGEANVRQARRTGGGRPETGGGGFLQQRQHSAKNDLSMHSDAPRPPEGPTTPLMSFP